MSIRARRAACVIAGLLLLSSVAAAQTAAPLRTAWGAPDLGGVWDFRSITPLERPEELTDREFLTEEEAAQLEQDTLDRNARLLTRPAERTTVADQVDRREDGTPGFYNNFWLDRGTTTVETRRTSLIVDPPEWTYTLADGGGDAPGRGPAGVSPRSSGGFLGGPEV